MREADIKRIDMAAQIIYAEKISFQQENKLSPQIMKNHFHHAIEINNILAAKNKRVAYFFIDPLLHSFEAANNFYFGILECNTIRKINTYKTGAGPIQAITDANELIKNDLYDAIFIFGHEPLLSDTRNYGRDTIKKAMEIFEDFSLIRCYDLLARQLCRETDISNEITVTRGMNIARAPWNNPALNGLIEITEQLLKGNWQYGMVHGNGGIGEAQGITVLERPYDTSNSYRNNSL